MAKEDRGIANTPLARWVNEQMSQWVDPETGRAGLTANKLAVLSGVSQTSTFEILKDGITPKAEILVKLADFFGVSPLFLFRLVYAPDEDLFPPETRAKLAELEAALSRVPTELQVQFIEGLAVAAKMQLAAMEYWAQVEK